MRLSPKMRRAAYYTVEAAGRMEPVSLVQDRVLIGR